MIDKEDEIRLLGYKLVERYPNSFMQVLIHNGVDDLVVGNIYYKDDKERKFWISTLEIMNEKLRKRELTL
jgi:hypothetical protein